jgi:poly [ADP-ribose] polymerase 10/14/15
VKYGDITKDRCDAIVNSTNDKLDLRFGALSQAIVKAGGDVIAQECKSLGGLTDGLAVTGAGLLPCKHVFHVVVKADFKLLKATVKKCLAEAEKMKLTSLVIPPLGTGRTGSTGASEAAEAIFEEIGTFADSKPQYLKKIIVIAQNRGMVDEFVSAVEKFEKMESHILWNLWGKLKNKVITFFTTSPPEKEDQLKSSTHHAGHSKLCLSIYSLSDHAIDSAIQGLEQMCRESKKSNELKNDDVKTFIAKLTSEQNNKLKLLESQYDVTIEIDKSSTDGPKIIVKGDADAIGSVVQDIYQLIMQVKDMESHQREVELLAKQAVWECDNGANFVAYDKQGTGTLEKAYIEKKATVEWVDNGGKHVASLSNPQDMHDTYNGKKLAIRRSVPGTISLPTHWTPVPSGLDYTAVSLVPSSPEFTTVQQSLMQTAGGLVKTIVKIERIQNPFLYRQYMTKKLEMDQRNGSNEMRLWHGTAGNNVPNISGRNFNRSYGGVHGLAIGNGVYFATTSQYSIHGYTTADSSGYRYIYQAQVLIGKSTPGQSGLKEAPPGYDSVSGSGMYVVFYDAQTYPEYLITFT